MKRLPDSDFRARRFMLEKKDFALAKGRYAGPTNLIGKETWRSIVDLPDDVSIRTSDRYGPQLKALWDHWGSWVRVVLGVQALSRDPRKSPLAIASCDASDELQAGVYCALVGYYRVAFSCLRNVLEQMIIGAHLSMSRDRKDFKDWRDGEDRIRFGWAADMLPKNSGVAALEQHLHRAAKDSLFGQAPKGFTRRLFRQLSKYTHGSTGFTDADFRQSNGPIFVPAAFKEWSVVALKTYVIAIHALKVAAPKLRALPYGPPAMTLDQVRRNAVQDVPNGDKDRLFLDSLASFWP